MLDRADLSATFEDYPADDKSCHVVSQDRRAGSKVEIFTTITLTCEARVPDVRGESAEAADTKLFDQGFRTNFQNEPPDLDVRSCRVAQQSRTGLARPGTAISLRLSCGRP
jgi:beta-lactam-binding protein with PASTA domain